MSAERRSPDPGEALVLRCVAPGASPAELRSLAEQSPDWDAAVALAQAQGVATLMARALRRADVEPPSRADAALRAEVRHGGRWGVMLATETVQVLRALDRGGVRALPIKGAALGVIAYGDMSVRRSGDVDVLVAPGDVGEAEHALATAGYGPADTFDAEGRRWFERTIRQLPARARPGGLPVEVHAALHPAFIAMDLDHDGIRARAKPVDLGIATVDAPCAEDTLLIVATHALRSGWTRLEWAVSVAWLAARPGLDWGLVERVARKAGCARAVAMGLHLVADGLGVALPPAAARLAGADQAARRLASELAAEPFWAMPAYEESAPPDRRVRTLQIRARERVRDRARYVSRALAPTTIEVRTVRLPHALHWLYVPLRVARVARRVPGLLFR